MYKILTIVVFVFLFGCESKEYRKKDNPHVETVEQLNKSDYQTIIQRLEGRENLSEREVYYLSSAYSEAAGVDVFSLYPVLEIQLFHKNALNWSDLSKEKNPYLKFMKSQTHVDEKIRNEKRLEKWNKYSDKIKKSIGQMEFLPYSEVKDDQFPSFDEQAYAELILKFQKIYDSVLSEKEQKPDLLKNFNWKMSTNEEGINDGQFSFRASNSLYEVFMSRLRFEEKKDDFFHPEKKSTIGSIGGWEMVYMNVLWNTYEAIPVIKKMPSLSDAQQLNLTKSLNLQLILLESKDFREVAIKNIAILVSVSLLSIYKSSIDLEEVALMKDLYCSFNPMGLIENYKLLRERFLFLLDALKKSKIEEKAVNQYADKIEEFKKLVPKELSSEEIESYVKGVDEFKVESCF